MSLKACSTCGYAVSILDSECRHCISWQASSFRPFGPRHLTQIGIALVIVALVIAFFLFR